MKPMAVNVQVRSGAPPGSRVYACMRRLALLAMAMATGAAQAGDCTVATSGPAFGTVDPLAASPVDANGSVQVSCLPGLLEILTGVSVTISLGTGGSGTYASRTMRLGTTSTLSYNLYTTAARTTVWGNGTGGTQTVGGAVGGLFSGQPSPRSFPVYGRIPGNQDPAAGLHGDTVIVTVTF